MVAKDPFLKVTVGSAKKCDKEALKNFNQGSGIRFLHFPNNFLRMVHIER